MINRSNLITVIVQGTVDMNSCGTFHKINTPCKEKPLFRVLLQKTSQQGLGFGGQIPGETDLLHENEFKQTLVVLVVERQPATHHLIHDYAQTPPVHCPSVVIIF